MRRKHKKRKRDLHRHARRRVWERCGVEVTSADLERIEHEIRAGRGNFHSKQSNTRSVFLVTIGDVTVRAIYDKPRGAIVTVLPLTTEARR